MFYCGSRRKEAAENILMKKTKGAIFALINNNTLCVLEECEGNGDEHPQEI